MIKKTFKTIKLSVFRTQTITAFGAGGMMGDWDWGDMMGTGWGGGIFFVMGGILMILFWIIVIMAGLAFLRWLISGMPGNINTSNKAMDILKEKYAKGEITKEEFETKKKDLV